MVGLGLAMYGAVAALLAAVLGMPGVDCSFGRQIARMSGAISSKASAPRAPSIVIEIPAPTVSPGGHVSGASLQDGSSPLAAPPGAVAGSSGVFPSPYVPEPQSPGLSPYLGSLYSGPVAQPPYPYTDHVRQPHYPSTGHAPQAPYPATGHAPQPPYPPTGHVPQPPYPPAGQVPPPPYPPAAREPQAPYPSANRMPQPAYPSAGHAPPPPYPSTGHAPQAPYPSASRLPQPTYPHAGHVPPPLYSVVVQPGFAPYAHGLQQSHHGVRSPYSPNAGQPSPAPPAASIVIAVPEDQPGPVRAEEAYRKVLQTSEEEKSKGEGLMGKVGKGVMGGLAVVGAAAIAATTAKAISSSRKTASSTPVPPGNSVPSYSFPDRGRKL